MTLPAGKRTVAHPRTGHAKHRSRSAYAALCAVACVLAALLVSADFAAPKPVRAASVGTPHASAQGDAVCGRCHAEIVARYSRTPMAHGSGPARDGMLTGGFTHSPSGVTYSVQDSSGDLTLEFKRPGTSADAGDGLHGTRRLQYFVGSNHRGRTFLYQEEHTKQWFEVPINFYSRRAVWDMAPNFDHVTRMPGPLPTDANCLHCHATEVARPLAQAANAFAGAPFAQGGVGCAACHGDPSAHLAAASGRGPIVNPAHLPVARRDSICLQCHLEGDAMVSRPGTSLADFRPGDDLAERAVYFVRASRETGGGRASSQWEALLRSACRRGAGDRLTCTTCHDPHGSPPEAERVAWFRGRCLQCHSTPAIAVTHHPEQQDCAACHMPTRSTSDISHEQATDHNIQAHPESATAVLKTLGAVEDLLPVGGVEAGDREYGLAYAQLAGSGDRAMGERAAALLHRAEKSGANDASLHTELGYLSQRAGDSSAALREYSAALEKNPYDATALGNLAVLQASTGNPTEAIALLKRLVAADPAKTAASLNLAYLQCSLGDKAAARTVLEQAQRIDPDNELLRRFLNKGEYAGGRCLVRPQAPEAHASR